ncbi:MAG TPA: FKBP-type peptidyl-prolyl cis-trans isomerase [Polyangiaceae bacterium]|nr:FKBP-type peptidyl-prolyl cis-trans isomerase [Polyangiaceae bacterium]
MASRRRRRPPPTAPGGAPPPALDAGDGAQAGDGTQVGPGTVVGLGYSLYDAEDELVEASDPDEPLTYIHGYGQLLPALEAALEGMVAGQERSVWLDENDAFGPHDPEQVFEVERDEFPEPERVQPGDEFGVEGEGGGFSLRVIDVVPDGFLVDANHPLAGQRLRVLARVEHVRPASGGELDEAERALEALQAEGEPGAGAPAAGGAGPGGLLSAESLLRRGGRGRGEA